MIKLKCTIHVHLLVSVRENILRSIYKHMQISTAGQAESSQETDEKDLQFAAKVAVAN